MTRAGADNYRMGKEQRRASERNEVIRQVGTKKLVTTAKLLQSERQRRQVAGL
jgi:hypothetical protein